MSNTERFYHDCKVLNVVDGDTVDILVDHGFSIFSKQRFRLYGIDAPEMKGDTLIAAKASKQFLSDLVLNNSYTISTLKDKTDKYGRYLVIIYLDVDAHVTANERMVETGNAIARYWT